MVELCCMRKVRQAKLKPAVSLSIADTFNQVVCLDLKEIKLNQKQFWILHLINAATRYTAVRLITTKKKEVIVSRLFEMWIQYFGRQTKLMTDNGGEFNKWYCGET